MIAISGRSNTFGKLDITDTTSTTSGYYDDETDTLLIIEPYYGIIRKGEFKFEEAVGYLYIPVKDLDPIILHRFFLIKKPIKPYHRLPIRYPTGFI